MILSYFCHFLMILFDIFAIFSDLIQVLLQFFRQDKNITS
jgi:hypothetical protein